MADRQDAALLGWTAGAWARVGPAALRARDHHGVPQLHEIFEALAAKQGS